MTEPLGLEAIRARHQIISIHGGQYCAGCRDRYGFVIDGPCDAVRLCDEVERLRAEFQALLMMAK